MTLDYVGDRDGVGMQSVQVGMVAEEKSEACEVSEREVQGAGEYGVERITRVREP